MTQAIPQRSAISKASERFTHTLTDARTESTELWTAMLTVGFGVVLIAPLNTFAAASSWRLFPGLATEWQWGWFAVTLGMAGLTATFFAINRLRILIHVTCFVFWTTVVLLFVLGGSMGTAPVTYAIVALARLWTALRITGIVRPPQSRPIAGESDAPV